MDRLKKDTKAISNIATLLKQDRNGLHLSQEDLNKATEAVEQVVLVLAKHAVNIEVNRLRS